MKRVMRGFRQRVRGGRNFLSCGESERREIFGESAVDLIEQY